MMAGDGTGAAERSLYILIALAAVMSVGHHVDHVIRGNNVGWPIESDVNAFTFSLLIYPLILIGLLVYRAGKVGPGFWVFLSAGGALFVAFIHFTPGGIEPPSEIVDPYDPPILGWLAFAWLVAFVGVLAFTSLYEARLLRRRRRRSAGSSAPSSGHSVWPLPGTWPDRPPRCSCACVAAVDPSTPADPSGGRRSVVRFAGRPPVGSPRPCSPAS